jgi:hypothetical protein
VVRSPDRAEGVSSALILHSGVAHTVNLLPQVFWFPSKDFLAASLACPFCRCPHPLRALEEDASSGPCALIFSLANNAGDFHAILLLIVFMLNGWLFRHVCLARSLAANAVLLCLTQLSEKADQSDNDGRDANGDVDNGCRRVRTHDNPENSTSYYSERNEISQYRVLMALPQCRLTVSMNLRTEAGTSSYLT